MACTPSRSRATGASLLGLDRPTTGVDDDAILGGAAGITVVSSVSAGSIGDSSGAVETITHNRASSPGSR